MQVIPHGQVVSYGDLARTVGGGARPIGNACARNPLPVIIPCHRVLSAGGAIGGYSGGHGPATKRWLLRHEAKAAR